MIKEEKIWKDGDVLQAEDLNKILQKHNIQIVGIEAEIVLYENLPTEEQAVVDTLFPPNSRTLSTFIKIDNTINQLFQDNKSCYIYYYNDYNDSGINGYYIIYLNHFYSDADNLYNIRYFNPSDNLTLRSINLNSPIYGNFNVQS